MKSLVGNVFSMALGVACLALVLNRPSAADDEPVAQEQKQVVVVKTDDGKTAELQEQVIVVRTDGEQADVADAMKKALRGKFEGLPAEIQKKIQQKLKAVKAAGDGKKNVQVEVIAVGSDDEAGTVERSASEEEYTATVVARAFPDAQEKHVAVAIAVDDQEAAGADQLKTITVTVKDGQVMVNGKPVKAPALEGMKKGQIKVLVGADAKVGEGESGAKNDGDQVRKALRRKMLIMSKDGGTKTLNIDVDSDVGAITVGEATVVVEGKAGPTAEAEEGTVTWTIVGDDDAKQADGVHKFHVRALQGKPGPGQPKFDFITAAPGMPMPHAFYFQPGPAGKANAEMAKRLKGIESELKQIRKLLEEMQKEDADD